MEIIPPSLSNMGLVLFGQRPAGMSVLGQKGKLARSLWQFDQSPISRFGAPIVSSSACVPIQRRTTCALRASMNLRFR
jgi:hypothetical protein